MGVIRGSSYYTVVDGPTWSEAQSKAESLGGNLVSFSSKEEETFVINYAESISREAWWWMGMEYDPSISSMKWINGEEYGYENWYESSGVKYPEASINLKHYKYTEFTADPGRNWAGATPSDGQWAIALPTSRRKGVAEIPFKQRGDSIYVIVEGATWEQAEANAVELGGNLVTINSQAENDFLSTEVRKLIIDLYGIKYGSGALSDSTEEWRYNPMIGYSDSRIEGDWKWSSGQSSKFSNWHPGEPNSRLGNEDYGVMYMFGYINKYNALGEWNDSPGGVIGIAEIALGPTYSITPEVSSINEGSRFKTNVSTTGVTEGTRLYWTISGTGIDANDFSAGALKGSRLVKSDGSITFAHTLANDLTTEGSETLEIKLFSDWARTTQVGDTATVTINDTSIQQKSYYSIGDVQGYEGDTLYALISRTGNIDIAHSLSLSASNGTAFSGFDFVAPSSTLSFAAGESSKLVAIRTIEDSLVESDETFSLSLSGISSGAVISDGSATLTILNDDSNTVQNFYQSYSYNVDNSTNYKVNVGNVNSKGGSVVIGGSGNIVGNSSTTTTVNVDYKFIGGASADVLKGYSGDNFGADLLDGGDGDDDLTGYRGADFLNGGAGNDILRAGNGRDILTGGDGADVFYGGFGLNTFEDELDGEIDQLYFRSDQWAENWLYGSAGNSPNGEKADKIEMLDEFDQIYVQGVETSQLSYGFVDHNSNLGETLSGIGIYASGALEAVYVGGNLSMGQIASMTQGIL